MRSAHTWRPNASNSQLFLTSDEAATYLGLKRCTLEAWRCRGGGPKYLKFGNAVRYRLSDLESWIESRARSNTSEGVRA